MNKFLLKININQTRCMVESNRQFMINFLIFRYKGFLKVKYIQRSKAVI